MLLGVQQPWPAWRHALNIAFDDLWLVLVPPLFLAWLVAGRGPLRAMLLAWTALYLFLIVVVFHSEIRYRMPLAPYAMAGAAGGLAVLARGDRANAGADRGAGGCGRHRARRLAPYAGPAWRGAVAVVRLQPAGDALARGDGAAAAEAAARAVAADPTSTWPWIRYARWLVRAGRPAEALDAYARAEPLRETPWEPPATRPALLAELGRAGRSARRRRRRPIASPCVGDSWLLLEVAWRALPAPRTDEVLLARGRPGRGARLPPAARRVPLVAPAARGCGCGPAPSRLAYELVIEMGAPPPSPDGGMEVEVAVDGGDAQRVRDRRGLCRAPLRRRRSRRWSRGRRAARAPVEPDRATRVAGRRGAACRARPDRDVDGSRTPPLTALRYLR